MNNPRWRQRPRYSQARNHVRARQVPRFSTTAAPLPKPSLGITPGQDRKAIGQENHPWKNSHKNQKTSQRLQEESYFSILVVSSQRGIQAISKHEVRSGLWPWLTVLLPRHCSPRLISPGIRHAPRWPALHVLLKIHNALHIPAWVAEFLAAPAHKPSCRDHFDAFFSIQHIFTPYDQHRNAQFCRPCHRGFARYRGCHCPSPGQRRTCCRRQLRKQSR